MHIQENVAATFNLFGGHPTERASLKADLRVHERRLWRLEIPSQEVCAQTSIGVWIQQSLLRCAYAGLCQTLCQKISMLQIRQHHWLQDEVRRALESRMKNREILTSWRSSEMETGKETPRRE